MATDNSSDSKDQWEIFCYFLGDWTGTGTGVPGISSTERSYRLTLSDQFIEIKSRSVYEPQEKNPSGEVHDEFGMISYDKTRSTYVIREFHVEGYVNQYVLESSTIDNTKLVFVTEAIENIPPGWRARTALEILSEDSFRETFELSGPDKGWTCYITNELHRVSDT